MDTLCRRLEDLTGQLTQSINALNQPPATRAQDTANEDLLQAAQVLKSMPGLKGSFHGHDQASAGSRPESRPAGVPNGHVPRNPATTPHHHGKGGHTDSADEEDDLESDLDSRDSMSGRGDDGETNRAGAMVRDSYGHLRCVTHARQHITGECALMFP